MKKIMSLKVLFLVVFIGIVCTAGMFALHNGQPTELPAPVSSTNPPIDTATITTDIVTVNPSEVASVATPTPDLSLCQSCNTQQLASAISYSDITRLGNQRLCADNYAFGVDLEEQRIATLSQKCNNCDFALTTENTEIYWTCNGFNNSPS